MKYCLNCGAEVPDNAKYCLNCGVKISDTISLSRKKKHSTFNKSNNKIFIIVCSILLFIIPLVLVLTIGSSNEENKNNQIVANELFDEIIPVASSDTTIKPGIEYAYMSDSWNVYIAKSVSNNVIKIEHWSKSGQSNKSMKYESDLGSFNINDEENGFSWLDNQQTAFTFIIQDENNSEINKPTGVIFTINNNDLNANKGTNYNENIACYTYESDDWHIYRAIPLTENLVKIECWYRTSSGFFSSHRFARDLGVINTETTKTDFAWGDEEHNAFIITMHDPENKSYWKEEKLTSFILENKNYEYPTVISYLNHLSNSNNDSFETNTSDKPQNNGITFTKESEDFKGLNYKDAEEES